MVPAEILIIGAERKYCEFFDLIWLLFELIYLLWLHDDNSWVVFDRLYAVQTSRKDIQTRHVQQIFKGTRRAFLGPKKFSVLTIHLKQHASAFSSPQAVLARPKLVLITWKLNIFPGACNGPPWIPSWLTPIQHFRARKSIRQPLGSQLFWTTRKGNGWPPNKAQF